jgi:hypothetical protein
LCSNMVRGENFRLPVGGICNFKQRISRVKDGV